MSETRRRSVETFNRRNRLVNAKNRPRQFIHTPLGRALTFDEFLKPLVDFLAGKLDEVVVWLQHRRAHTAGEQSLGLADDAEEERRGKDEMEHMGDRSRREAEKSKERRSEKSPQRPAHTSKA